MTCPNRTCDAGQACPHSSLPFPVGTVLRCTRWTQWGTETVYGRVQMWHNEQGWLVVSPHGGIAAAPGPGVFVDFREPHGLRVEPEEWRFEPVVTVIDGTPGRVNNLMTQNN